MATYRVRYATKVEVTVEIEIPDSIHPADQGERAADDAWDIAENFLQTIGTQQGDQRITSVEASLDGIGAHEVEEI